MAHLRSLEQCLERRLSNRCLKLSPFSGWRLTSRKITFLFTLPLLPCRQTSSLSSAQKFFSSLSSVRKFFLSFSSVQKFFSSLFSIQDSFHHFLVSYSKTLIVFLFKTLRISVLKLFSSRPTFTTLLIKTCITNSSHHDLRYTNALLTAAENSQPRLRARKERPPRVLGPFASSTYHRRYVI